MRIVRRPPCSPYAVLATTSQRGRSMGRDHLFSRFSGSKKICDPWLFGDSESTKKYAHFDVFLFFLKNEKTNSKKKYFSPFPLKL
jgi:hypothetical protein